MTKYWFKPKTYGYGFYPITWQGWLATLALLVALFASAYTNGFFDLTEDSVLPVKDGVRYLLDIFIIVSVFTALCKDKVDGGLQWKWGNKKDY